MSAYRTEVSTALPQLLSFTEELRANAGQFVDAGLNCITQLLTGLIAGLPQLIAYVPDVRWAVSVLALLAGVISAVVDNVATVLMVAPVGLAIARRLRRVFPSSCS